jgi:hypothetical protein
MSEQQTFFIGNTHYSTTHPNHNNNLVATEWSLGISNQNRESGFEQYKPLNIHTNFNAQTTLDMFTPGGHMNTPKTFL